MPWRYSHQHRDDKCYHEYEIFRYVVQIMIFFVTLQWNLKNLTI
jgi:hypothetical protein